MIDIMRTPDYVELGMDNDAFSMDGHDGRYSIKDVDLRLTFDGTSIGVSISAIDSRLRYVILRWYGILPYDSMILGDAWERAYGDLEWRGIVSERVMPWYFLVHDGLTTVGYGVKTGASAFASWMADSRGIRLMLDIQSGGVGVRLNGRTLKVAEIVMREGPADESPYQAAHALCTQMCHSPRLPDHAVYGGNNWYYAYGDSSHERILRDSELIASYSPEVENRPYMVIDAGWAKDAGTWNDAANGSDWSVGNERFPDMQALASEMTEIGVRPGIWIRPLAVPQGFSASLLLPNQRNSIPGYDIPVLDPSIPENLLKVEEDINRLYQWGYRLIKHDFTCFDILGRWLIGGSRELTNAGWHFNDQSRTTAEIVLDLYDAIRRGASDSVVIGCNTFGHLGAGLFELQRIGDDTSGKEWDRTRRMGVNALGFRCVQHRAFFFTDADCVGLTRDVPWEMNKKWLDVLARSGTPLFVSAEEEAMGEDQIQAVKKAFVYASRPQSTAEPLDWLHAVNPRLWKFCDEMHEYVWDL